MKKKDKRSVLCLVCLVLVCAMGMTSCMTYIVPKPESQDDTLLVICTGRDFSGVIEYFSYLELKFWGVDEPVHISGGNPFILLQGIKLGVLRVESLTLFYKGAPNWESIGSEPKPKKMQLDVKTELEPGSINFFPVKLIYVTRMSNNEVSWGWTQAPISNADKSAALQALAKSENYKFWKIPGKAQDGSD